jgi:hypothetical protein
MCFLFSGAFWGMVLVLLGLSIIIKVVFHVHLPIVRIVFGLIIIYFGVRLIAGGFWPHRCCGGPDRVFFTESKITAATFTGREHSVVFGKSVVDATGPLGEKNRDFNVNTVFGQTDLRISSAVPTICRVNAAFSGAQFPDGNTIAFGDYTYKSKSYSEGVPCRTIKANVVFGGLRIIEE